MSKRFGCDWVRASEAIPPETNNDTTMNTAKTIKQMANENYLLDWDNKQLTASLKDMVATLMALSAKHQDGMENLVGTSVYNARKVLESVEINARARNA